MDSDDRPVGRILSRREALALLGTVGAALLAACSRAVPPYPPPESPTGFLPTSTAAAARLSPVTPSTAEEPEAESRIVPGETAASGAAPARLTPSSAPTEAALPVCVVRPELTEGPYFVDAALNRSDIRSNPADGVPRDGLPLALTLRLARLDQQTCTPLAGTQVDLWQCDALGVYSDVNDPGFSTVGQQFLRGSQVSDESGVVRFTTIYPGWYSGRAVHIHFKIRTPDGYEFTSQFFFDDALTDQVHAQAPYAAKGPRNRRNDQDGIYRSGGDQLVLPVTLQETQASAVFDIALQMV